MPLIEVEIVAGDESGASNLAQRLADALGGVFGSAPGHTWIRVHHLDATQYAENDSRDVGDDGPVFLKVLEGTRPTGSELAERVAQLAAATAAVVERPVEAVHVVYLESGEGRVAFGGKL